MNPSYSNQNHAIHRSQNPFEKVATIYDKQGKSNRQINSDSLSFDSLSATETEQIKSYMEKDAAMLADIKIEKTAMRFKSPFDVFSQTKNYVATKLGVSDEMAHDLSSAVITKAEDMVNNYGVDMAEAVTGIVDYMDGEEIQERTGAVPMRPKSKEEISEHIKSRLMNSLQLSSFDADRVKMNVIQQARNLSTIIRNVDNSLIADAIVDVLVAHNDVSIVYNISSSDRLVNEVKAQLNDNS